jgi:hypothetical protein
MRQTIDCGARRLTVHIMLISYDTESDSISSPDLSSQQTTELQARLVAALGRNDPVRVVAQDLLEFARGMRHTS